VFEVSIVMKQFDSIPFMKETSISWSFSQSVGHSFSQFTKLQYQCHDYGTVHRSWNSEIFASVMQIHGGGSGIGTFAIQTYSKSKGCESVCHS